MVPDTQKGMEHNDKGGNKMATKTVRVTIEREIEITIPDNLLTEESIKEFSDYIFVVEQADDVFKYAAECLFNNNDDYVEGLGQGRWRGSSLANPLDDILYEQRDNYVESVIVG